MEIKSYIWILFLAFSASRIGAQMPSPPTAWEFHGAGLTLADSCPQLALHLLEASTPELCLPDKDWKRMLDLARSQGRDSTVAAWLRQRKEQERGSSVLAQALVDSLFKESNRVHRPKYLKAEAWILAHTDSSFRTSPEAKKHLALAQEKWRVDQQVSAKINLFSALQGFPGAGALGTKKYTRLSLLMDRVTVANEGYWNYLLADGFLAFQVFPEDWARWQDRQLKRHGQYPGYRYGSLPGVEWVEDATMRNAINQMRIGIGLPALFPCTVEDAQWIFSGVYLWREDWDCGK